MTTNRYFDDLYDAKTADQQLVESLIIESIQIHGRDLYYLPRDLNNFDSFFGEDQASNFDGAIALEFYMENIESWQDDGAFLSKFGYELRDSATFTCSKLRFTTEITAEYPEIERPREGDVLVLVHSIDRRRRPMEITNVRNEEIFYELGKLYIWTITVKNFEYSGEKFNTGVESIDNYQKEYGISTEITVEAGTDSGYIVGETVSQVTGFSGTVLSFGNDVLVLTRVEGQLNNSQPLFGDESNVTRNIVSVDSQVGNDTVMNDNDLINEETIDDGLLDFSEGNPLTS